jgi:hypothetical protein
MTRRKKNPAVRLTARGMQIVRELRARFEQKFGRAPGSGDPLSFQAEADVSGPIDQLRFDAAIIGAMETVGVSPAIIHAYRRTGLLVTEHNVGACSMDDLSPPARRPDPAGSAPPGPARMARPGPHGGTPWTRAWR